MAAERRDGERSEVKIEEEETEGGSIQATSSD